MQWKLQCAVALALILSGVAAGPAAAEESFHTESEKTTLTGRGWLAHEIDAAGASISCLKSTFSGSTESKTTQQITLTASYSSCSFLGASVTVSMGSCDYLLKANGEFAINGASCATNPITYQAPGCKISIGPQAGLVWAFYQNLFSGASREILVTLNVSSIKYTATGFLCPKTGTYSDGRYTESWIELTAEKPETFTMVGLWWE